jgi:hypothetical protein
MTKVLVCIANYENKQIHYLKSILEEYSKFNSNYDISVVLFSTYKNENIISNYSSLKIIEKIYDPKIGVNLPHEHKLYMSEQLNNYDLFIYTENDILITSRNIDRFVKLSSVCNNTMYIPGFVRFEKCNDNKVISLVDCHPRHSKHFGGRGQVIKKKIVINDSNFFIPWNVHQGSYVLTAKQYEKILQSPNYFKSNGFSGGPLETAASGTYAFCGFEKVVSYDFLEDCLIHHLSNKYCRKISFPIENFKNIYLEKK